MRLNLDCIRDILLCVETNTDLHTFCFFYDMGIMQAVADCLGDDEEETVQDYQEQLWKHYENDELFYHVRYCVEAGLLEEMEGQPMYKIVVTDLTPKGHEFLANIRNNSIWNKVKTASATVGIGSLKGIIQLASSIADQVINTYLSGP